ncbi:hypothetical protein PsYK624_151480 [Phanerochaete sordida]|uniref:Uncharacterized protein n=1 Tax=Phanerochaete sordida TaxID=48140 RepID=A0A9P3GQA9_9APHY|nr:hypothetical protein PsYK624_151480 [Phanerochaete sordida]
MKLAPIFLVSALLLATAAVPAAHADDCDGNQGQCWRNKMRCTWRSSVDRCVQICRSLLCSCPRCGVVEGFEAKTKGR